MTETSEDLTAPEDPAPQEEAPAQAAPEDPAPQEEAPAQEAPASQEAQQQKGDPLDDLLTDNDNQLERRKSDLTEPGSTFAASKAFGGGEEEGEENPLLRDDAICDPNDDAADGSALSKGPPINIFSLKYFGYLPQYFAVPAALHVIAVVLRGASCIVC